MVTKLEGLPYVDRRGPNPKPAQAHGRSRQHGRARVKLGGVTLRRRVVSCARGLAQSIRKTRSSPLKTAHAIKEAGAHALRGGVWKPRTNPYSYQGDAKALLVLREAARQTGLAVDTEVMDEEHLNLAVEAGVNCLQIGARQRAELRAAPPGRPRHRRARYVRAALSAASTWAPCRNFISAAEYIVQLGNPNVILCPRGTQPALDGYRNTRTRASSLS